MVTTYSYKGTVVSKNIIPDIALLESFKSRPDDVIVVTFPKSGTHYISEIVDLIVHDADVERIRAMPHSQRWGTLEGFDQLKYNIRNIDDLPSPRIIWSHIPYDVLPEEVKKSKIIYMIRNPKDLIRSYHYFHKHHNLINFDETLEQMVQRMIDDKALYTPFWKHVLSFWNRRNEKNVLFLYYEDVLKNTSAAIKAIMKHLDKQLDEESVQAIVKYTNFDEMKKVALSHLSSMPDKELAVSLFFRNGRIGLWKNEFSPSLSEKLDEWISENIKDTGLEFQYE